jgi:protein O-GlcNAc transferase
MQSESFRGSLSAAHEFARLGKNDDFLQSCQALANAFIQDQHALTQIASLLISFGFSSQAKRCLDRATLLAPGDKNTLLSLALCELQMGSIPRFHEITQELLNRYPNDLQVLSQILYLSEYIDDQNQEPLLYVAKRWGACAIEKAGGFKPRPAIDRISSEPLRLAYVSADFCQHTVGILIKEVLRHHNTDRVKIYCYSSGTTKDWVTEEIASRSIFADVSKLSDQDLARRIEQDQIDILIDLSGHTGGSRLAAFAYRPAPIMLSMLGYYATTGLEYMDGALLDSWHICEDTQRQFIEPIIPLPNTRWCFYPAFPAPLIAQPPSLKNGFITFGSFNNTLKYNPQVFALWAQILKEIPNSKLVLKWRTLNDPIFKQFIWDQFKTYGINTSRVELRGPSFHMQMLEEYADIDIALDPFPFSGGVTSCEALYMGVPVITWPQAKVVSRQTYAFLSIIGHPEWVANNQEEYVSIAKTLAQSPENLIRYRNALRTEMIRSPLMDLKIFTSLLEHTLVELHQNVL